MGRRLSHPQVSQVSFSFSMEDVTLMRARCGPF
jgi:hypothetical protein